MIGIGLVGAGSFGEFCLAAFAELPEVHIAAIADVDQTRAERFAQQYDAQAYPDIEALVQNPEVEIVALNTPPYLHGSQGLIALNAKKHLFCEKPLATTVADGQQMIEAARANGVRLTVDYVMRHNPYWAASAAIAKSGVLGTLRHIDLANHANGLGLPANHWFWDAQKSGGIWVEHGVHFFDAFAWLTDQPGEFVGGQAFTRPDGAVDRVEGVFRYGKTAVHCYHAFDQSKTSEQTTVRLTFEDGYVTLREWVPTSLELLTEVESERWRDLIPGHLEQDNLTSTQHLLRAYAPEGKSALYKQSIQAGLMNLIRAIAGEKLTVTGEAGLASLRIAVDATSHERTY